MMPNKNLGKNLDLNPKSETNGVPERNPAKKTDAMKRKILLGVFCFISLSMSAQVSLSCTYRESCEWDSDAQEWSNDCSGYEESSLFAWNKDETLFKHTTETMTSTYYVQSKEYDKVHDVYTYNVISDVGNKYYFIFDLKNKEVRAMPMGDNAELVLIRWYVKAIF